MVERREVNTARPEHSWIPFYRELAEKLVNGGWRERQGELVGIVRGIQKKLESEGIPVPKIAENLDQHIDPFTVFAVIARNLNPHNYGTTLQTYQELFQLESRLPERPEIPFVDNRSVGFFGKLTDVDVDGALLWDAFELVLGMDPIEESSETNMLAELIDMCLKIDEVGMTKLTGGFYWINPANFLRIDTLSVLLGDISRDELDNGDGKLYLECLIRARKTTTRPFAEINIDEWESRNIRANNKMWLVRAQHGEWTDAFVNNGYVGIGYGMDPVDLNCAPTRDEIRARYISEHPTETRVATIGQDVGNVYRFHSNIESGDYVVTPRRDGITLHYGKVVSDVTYYVNEDDGDPCRNRKDVIWNSRTLNRRSIGTFSWPQGTVSEVNVNVKRQVFAHMLRNGLPRGSIEPPLLEEYTINDMIVAGVFFKKAELERIKSRFEDKKNLILQGSPGVGKTFISKLLAYALMGERADDRIANVQFHQSYSYEEFVQGYRPTTNANDELKFELRDGVFMRLCEKARANDGQDFVMIIDEINRGNLSRVFGELLSLIEKDKRGDEFSVELLGGDEFSVPDNVYLLGTMNLADRSLAGMDYAMRRRFAFLTLKPQFKKPVFRDWLTKRHVPSWMVDQINDRMSGLNRLISDDYGSLGPNFVVGHSYFCDISDGVEDWKDGDWDRWYREIVKTEIQPLLEEYWFDDPKKADTEAKKLLGEEA